MPEQTEVDEETFRHLPKVYLSIALATDPHKRASMQAVATELVMNQRPGLDDCSFKDTMNLDNRIHAFFVLRGWA